MSSKSSKDAHHRKSFSNSNRVDTSLGSIALRSTVLSVAIPIAETQGYLEQLRSLMHSKEVLVTAGYILEKLSDEALEMKKRCSGCGKPMSRFKPKKRKEKKPHAPKNLGHTRKDSLSPVITTTGDTPRNTDCPSNVESHMRCRFHSGLLIAKLWSCCGTRSTDPPCTGREFHIPKLYQMGEIEKLWQYHQSTGGRNLPSHRRAVAIDCEMGTAKSGDSELIRVTLLDYFSGIVLVDNLVYPDVPMLHLNTRYSGVRYIDMENARRAGTCFYGRDNARNAILKFVGPSTLVVGHSAQHDLTALRWIHANVVDTYILESTLTNKVKKETSAALESALRLPTPSEMKPKENLQSEQTLPKFGQKRPKGSGQLSLKTLSRVKLGREIQNGRNGHDSVEDALAARDLVHTYLTTGSVSG